MKKTHHTHHSTTACVLARTGLQAGFLPKQGSMRGISAAVLCFAVLATIWLPNVQAQTRFALNPAGTEVTDNQTGLIWQRCAVGMTWSGTTCTDVARGFDHEASLAIARTTATNTGVAWRLPNVKELSSLVDTSLVNPAIDIAAFPATPAWFFWSASPSVSSSLDVLEAWHVHFKVGFVEKTSRDARWHVRLVRTGP